MRQTKFCTMPGVLSRVPLTGSTGSSQTLYFLPSKGTVIVP